MVTANGNGERKVTSLRELPQDIQPARDLWPGIEARLAEETRRSGSDAKPSDESARPYRLRLLAAAAVVAALAVGVWIGRSTMPAGKAEIGGTSASTSIGASEALHAAFVMDPRYMRERAALVKSLEGQLDALPPQSRRKVIASLATIRSSMKEIETALGRDPGNALLQELLVNTYQDEMRVLTAVHEATDAGRGI
jgi:hypothetical protein